jgi:ferredoxin-NADP reductase
MLEKVKCKVEDIKWENKSVFTLKLRPEKKIVFKAGQFCLIYMKLKEHYEKRPFTISSSPYDETLDFTIKLYGEFTNALSNLKKDEEVIVEGPFGNFTIEDDEKNLIFIAGGVGVTPFISMIRERIHSRKRQKITLIYAAETKEDILFKEELDNIKEEWFKKVYVLSQEKIEEEGYLHGRINREIIEKFVDTSEIKNTIFYLCGPMQMVKDMKEILISIGIDKENIKFEIF